MAGVAVVDSDPNRWPRSWIGSGTTGRGGLKGSVLPGDGWIEGNGGPGARVRVLGRIHSWGTGDSENGQALAVVVTELAPMTSSPANEVAGGGAATQADEPQLSGRVWDSVPAVDAAELRPTAEQPG